MKMVVVMEVAKGNAQTREAEAMVVEVEAKDKVKTRDKIIEGSIMMIPVHCILTFALFTPGECVDRTSTVQIFSCNVIVVKRAIMVGAVAVILEAMEEMDMIMALLDEMWVAEAVETPRPMVITTTIKMKWITGPHQ